MGLDSYKSSLPPPAKVTIEITEEDRTVVQQFVAGQYVFDRVEPVREGETPVGLFVSDKEGAEPLKFSHSKALRLAQVLFLPEGVEDPILKAALTKDQRMEAFSQLIKGSSVLGELNVKGLREKFDALKL